MKDDIELLGLQPERVIFRDMWKDMVWNKRLTLDVEEMAVLKINRDDDDESSFQTPLTPIVTSGASTNACYTKYSPRHCRQATQQVGYNPTKTINRGYKNYSYSHSIVFLIVPHEL